jgi:DNA-binding CsgD family transcriptional regulator
MVFPKSVSTWGVSTCGTSSRYRNDAITEKLSLSEDAVKEHLHGIFSKLGISNSSELTFGGYRAIHEG